MVSSAVAVREQSAGTRSNADPGDQTLLDGRAHFLQGIQPKELCPSGSEYAPKVRKPYTITKQRERWTEEEHKKFIEALKLYGRAWHRIEEHVGSKTAVQIRSHAQKFFSKVVRESSSSDASSVMSIEIPPPRPKRKPVRPYPRKMVQVKTGTSVTEQSNRSASPTLSVSEQEYHSPTSILSGVASETQASINSNTPNGGSSPVSSAGANSAGLSSYESNSSPEANRSQTPIKFMAIPSLNKQASMKLELFPQDGAFAKEAAAEAASTQSLKLFGKTVLVTDPYRPSLPAMETCKSLLPAMDEDIMAHSLPWNTMPIEKIQSEGFHCTWNPLLGGTPSIYYVPAPSKNSNLADASFSFPWCALYGTVPFPLFPLHGPVKAKSEQTHNREIEKDQSWTGSYVGSVSAVGEHYPNREAEAESGQHLSDQADQEEKEQSPEVFIRLSDRATSYERINRKPGECLKGFVPYKRCLAQRDAQSSSITGEESDDRRIDVCL